LNPSASRAQHGKGTAQISRICTSMAMAGTGPACAQTGGSRSYVRSRMVTLVGRLPGSFPVQRKLQERSDDPWNPWRSSGMMPRCLQ
jgi:hypothetical protein